MRVAWPPDFPPVLVHTAWRAEGGESLNSHPYYRAAKKKFDEQAALTICNHFGQERVLDELYDLAYGGDEPLIVSPSVAIEPTNALAVTYGTWLSRELGWEEDDEIFQIRTISRDFSTNGWFRLYHQPVFEGVVDPNRRYILADDVCTMGGTLAALRSWIEQGGGVVIGATALASKDGQDVQLALGEDTYQRLLGHFEGRLAEIFEQEFGYGLEGLTEPEGQFLLRCPDHDTFRAGVDEVRNA